MPLTLERSNSRKPIKVDQADQKYNSRLAGQALKDGLEYLQEKWGWSGAKIGRVCGLAGNTVTQWLTPKGSVPISPNRLSPDIQALIHLLAIHQSLDAMFDDPNTQLEWLSTYHPKLGMVPEEKMTESIAGLIFIRQYLDYVRGRGA